MIKRETVVSLLAGFLVGACGIAPVVAGSGFDFGPAQGAASGGGGSGDLTAITETGSGLTITSGTGPVPNLALEAGLEAIAGLAKTDGNVIVGDGSTWVAESGATARASLGALGGSLGATDNAIVTADGTGGATAQGTTATLDAGVLDLSDTGGSIQAFLCLGTGQTTSDVRLEVNSGNLWIVEGDDSALGPLAILLSLRAGSGGKIGFSSTSDGTGGTDTALSRLAAGSMFVENGSGSPAQLVASNVRSTSGGSASAPSYAHNSNTNCGLWFNASGVTPSLATVGRPSFTAGHQVTLTDNTATTIATIALASGARCGGTVNWSVDVTDGTDHQVVTGSFTFSAVDKAGTLTSDVDADATVSTAASAGTCTVTPTILDGTNQISLQITADTSLSPTAMLVRFNMDLSGTSAATVTLP